MDTSSLYEEEYLWLLKSYICVGKNKTNCECDAAGLTFCIRGGQLMIFHEKTVIECFSLLLTHSTQVVGEWKRDSISFYRLHDRGVHLFQVTFLGDKNKTAEDFSKECVQKLLQYIPLRNADGKIISHNKKIAQALSFLMNDENRKSKVLSSLVPITATTVTEASISMFMLDPSFKNVMSHITTLLKNVSDCDK